MNDWDDWIRFSFGAFIMAIALAIMAMAAAVCYESYCNTKNLRIREVHVIETKDSK